MLRPPPGEDDICGLRVLLLARSSVRVEVLVDHAVHKGNCNDINVCLHQRRSGQFVLDLMDTYGAGFAVLWTGFWELVGLMWIYGVCNVSKDIKLMLGSEPGW